jgi:hypothetical protein
MDTTKYRPVYTRTVGIAGEDIPKFSAVKYKDSNGEVYMTDTEGEPAAGVTDQFTAEGAPVYVIIKGECFINTSDAVVAGEKVYADGTAGKEGQATMLAAPGTGVVIGNVLETNLSAGYAKVELPVPNGSYL